MSFLYVFQKMIELFLIVMIGYIACKCGVFDKDARVKVTRLVLNVTLPAMILSSVMNQEEMMEAGDILFLLLIADASYVILLAVALIIPKVLRIKPSEEGVYRFMLAFG